MGSLLRVARDARGLTFVEVLVASLLLVLAVGALVPMLAVAQQTWDVAPYRTAMVQNARVAMDRMVREIRAAEAFQSLRPVSVLFTMYSTTVITVEYRRNTTTSELEYRRGTDPWQPLAGPFRSMTFTCFDAANVTISCLSPSLVRSVQIRLVAMDPRGIVPDITIISRAYRQAP